MTAYADGFTAGDLWADDASPDDIRALIDFAEAPEHSLEALAVVLLGVDYVAADECADVLLQVFGASDPVPEAVAGFIDGALESVDTLPLVRKEALSVRRKDGDLFPP